MTITTFARSETTWFGDLIDNVKNCQNMYDVFDVILQEIRTLEFEDCVFGASFAVPVTRENIIYLSSLPQNWQERYKKSQYISFDPRIIHGRFSQTPLTWNDDKIDSKVLKKLSLKQQAMWGEMLDNQIRNGIAVSSRLQCGSGCMLIVSRQKQQISEKECDVVIQRLDRILQVGRIEFLKRHQSETGTAVVLTTKEKEVMRWTCDGKTSNDIGEILNISTDTVNFHIKNAIKKLSVPNKTAAAVTAFALGLLF